MCGWCSWWPVLLARWHLSSASSGHVSNAFSFFGKVRCAGSWLLMGLDDFSAQWQQNEIAKPRSNKNRAVLELRGMQRHHYLGRNPSISGLSRVGFGMLPPPMYTLLPNTLQNWEALGKRTAPVFCLSILIFLLWLLLPLLLFKERLIKIKRGKCHLWSLAKWQIILHDIVTQIFWRVWTAEKGMIAIAFSQIYTYRRKSLFSSSGRSA